MRRRAHLSVAQVAARVGTSRPAITRTEHGWHTPTLDLCARVVAACGGTRGDLIMLVDYARAKLELPAPLERPSRRVHASRWAGPFVTNHL